MKLSNAIAVVTGGASGLGLATVQKIVAAGGKAAILDRPNSEGEKRALELGSAVIFAPADVTKEDAVTVALDKAMGLSAASTCASTARA
jgi:NAD(P)-dependent dehydrogenase (short-subunit alcohol dehydrogenase family)